MIRLLGFIIGSAVSIGAILLILGVPELHLSNPELHKNRFDEALQNLKEKQREIAAATSANDAEVPAPATPEVVTEPLPGPVALVDEPALTELPTELPAETDDGDELLLSQDRQWHSFWNPFRSEIAARGFVSQLERVTGLDYRVVKVKTGVYEVAFAYESDVERQAKLSQIQAATGLELPTQ
jgi:hypothetical protein